MRMRRALAALVLAGVPGLAVAQPAAGQGRMVRPNLLIHVVGNVDRSIAFFRDGVGLELAAPPAPLGDSALLQLVRAKSPTASAKSAIFRIPGSEMRFMLVEIQGAAGTPFEQRLFDPGVTRFSIQVRDLDAAFARVKSQVVVETAGGGPVFTQRPRNDTRAVMMRDPDGFVLEFVQADPPPQTDVPATSNVYNARSSLAVDDTEKSLAFYRGLLGFEARPTNTVAEAVLALEGTPAAVARTTATSPPGSTNVWFLWEFSRIARTPHAPAFADPGASALSLLVENLPAMLERMKAAGVKVETPGGQPIALGPSARGAVVRSPDGLLIELREQTAGR